MILNAQSCMICGMFPRLKGFGLMDECMGGELKICEESI